MTETAAILTIVAFALVVITALAALFTLRRGIRTYNSDPRPDDLRSDRAHALAVEQHRFFEVNLRIRDEVLLIHPAGPAGAEAPFTFFNVIVENVGESPVDILAALGSTRLVSSSYRPGAGLRGTGVHWSSNVPLYWNEPDPEALYNGISTTRNLRISADILCRLSPRETNVLHRIDLVNNPSKLKGEMYLKNRVFLAARGYPFGEILRQVKYESYPLEWRTVGLPNYVRWQEINLALENLDSMAFRIATAESDPLGLLATPDAWRFFLLHHHDFLETAPTQYGSITMAEVEKTFWHRFYPSRLLPRNFGIDHDYAEAREFCEASLGFFIERWNRLKLTIHQAADYDPGIGYRSDIFINPVKPSVESANDAYSMRIHCDGFYLTRWKQLVKEGYLALSHVEDTTDEVAIAPPADPRIAEPYITQIYYSLTKVVNGEVNINHQ